MGENTRATRGAKYLDLIAETLFPRDEVSHLLERAAPETLRAAIRAPLPDPTFPVRALFDYDDPLARLAVLLIKESRSRAVAANVGALLGEEILSWLGERSAAGLRADAVAVPVPSSPRSQRQRGYGQTELLGAGVAETLGCSATYAPRALHKIKETAKQALLPRGARLENLRGAFRADPAAVRGKYVALFDDVVTTGATLRAARTALRRAGAAEVSLFAVARAP